MEQVKEKKNKNSYEIIPVFNDSGRKIESIIEDAFYKYLKCNEYK